MRHKNDREEEEVSPSPVIVDLLLGVTEGVPPTSTA